MKKSSIIKFSIITFLIFIFLDFFIGSYIYKKFIRSTFIDVDFSFSAKDDMYDHKLKKSYKGLVGWGNGRYNLCTDFNGFRNSCKNINDKTKYFDIAFIGDSFTEAVGIDYENSFVGIISSNLKNKKIANLAVSSYSPTIYYSKINSLLLNGYSFKEIIVFIDLSDFVDDTVCYKLENNITVRRNTYKNCLTGSIKPNRIKKIFEKKLRLSFEFYNQVKLRLIKYKIIDYKVPNEQLDTRRSKWTYNYIKENYNNYSYNEAKSIIVGNMNKLSNLLKKNNIDLSIAVYPWPGTLKNDVANNKQVEIWKAFCSDNCINFYNFMNPFFYMLEDEKFSTIYQKVYIKNDHHFNEEGNKIIAESFLKLYKN